MSGEIKERRCLTCKKRLIDGIIPICPRCKLTGTKGVKKVGGWVAGIGVGIGVTAAALSSNSKDDNNQDQNNGNA